MILPEELAGMSSALRAARDRWIKADLEDSFHKLRWFGLILGGFILYTFYGGFVSSGRLAAQSGNTINFIQRVGLSTRAVISSTQTGLALLLFIIFAFLPWYQARKRGKELVKWSDEGIAEIAPTIRFETWLAWQKAPFTRAFLGLITLVALVQIFSHVRSDGFGSLMAHLINWDGTYAAGLVKEKYRDGQWWRLFTAPFLHGNIVHFLMNAAGLIYLGKRLEVFARWPHLPMVFLFSAVMGGVASAAFVPTPSVGASGGLMGWLGFLLVFETLHKRLIPRRARRRLAAGVFLTALIGLIGYRFIDNAAHAGGLLAGMAYGIIVFPPTSSPHRPRSTITDRIVGIASLAALTLAAVFAAMMIIVAP